MGRLFEILLFDSPIRFGESRCQRLYWSSDEPIDFYWRHEIHEDAFHQMLGQWDLVLYTEQVMQCQMGFRGDLGVGRTTRTDIIDAYQEHGLDISCVREEIRACRKSAKELKLPDIDSESDEGDSEEVTES